MLNTISMLFLIILISAFFLSSCVWLGDNRELADYPHLNEPLPPTFELVSWNIYKGKKSKEKIIYDLSEIKKHLGPEIICLQEGVPGIIPEDRDSIGLVAHFGRSFKWLFSREANGVITLSSTRPSDIPEPLLSRWKEGWIFTPKCSLATKYPVRCANNEIAELLVINFHGLNFQPVFKYMLKDQIGEIKGFIAGHQGPVIVCGDFNTWRKDRLALVQEAFEELHEVEFTEKRKGGSKLVYLVMGDPALPLDRIFYRGLAFEASGVLDKIDSSDHMPLFARFYVDRPDTETR